MKADFEKGTKVCSKCRKELPLNMFCKNKNKSDGLNIYCKECFSIIQRKQYRKDIEKSREKSRNRDDKRENTFQRKGVVRGNNGMLKRDYELTEEQLKRRNKSRKRRKINRGNINAQGVLIWYDGKLQDLEQMLKDNVYYATGRNKKRHITKWWKGEIRHWTVNDGIWKEG